MTRDSTRKPGRSYRTRFELDEDPISDRGAWLNGRADGIDWIDCISRDGRVFGNVSRMTVGEQRAEQGNLALDSDGVGPVGDYDDPTAILAGEWGRNQHAKATVFVRNPTNEYFQEVELRLRSTMEPHSCRGYEVFWRALKTDEGYAEIVRWNGEIGDWTSLERKVGAEFGVEDGDVVEATIVGNVITSIKNGVKIMSVIDDTFAHGAPGIGFNFFVGNTNVDHGCTFFEVETWDD
jgi:hypothetical protein